MNLRRTLATDDDGLSPVVGVVVLIGIVISAMSLILFAVSGYGVFQPEPDADLVYSDEKEDLVVPSSSVNVTIAVADAERLSEGNTRVQVTKNGETHVCGGVWTDSGDIEAGDVEIFTINECGDITAGENAETVQIVWSEGSREVLIDSHEIRTEV